MTIRETVADELGGNAPWDPRAPQEAAGGTAWVGERAFASRNISADKSAPAVELRRGIADPDYLMRIGEGAIYRRAVGLILIVIPFR